MWFLKQRLCQEYLDNSLLKANFEEKFISMKIAVPTRDGRVDDHFGHCAYYTIFNVIDGKVADVSKLASPEGCGCKSGIAPVHWEQLPRQG